MFMMYKSPGLLIAAGLIGLLLGAIKGRPLWGLSLGLLLGPIGWAITLALPGRSLPRGAGPVPGAGGSSRSSAGGCPRCGTAAAKSDGICGKCGNVLVPVHYQVFTRDS